MYFDLNIATIYTDTELSTNCRQLVYPSLFKSNGEIVKKECQTCFMDFDISLFYKRMTHCKHCFNLKRRFERKKSKCVNCDFVFRPGIQGRYKFCSEKCRFMSKVKIDLSDRSSCWIWSGHIQKKKGGYGTFVPEGGRSGLAHRASYRLFKGRLDNNLFVIHSCHNPICVSPNHLRQGTPMDNTCDRKKAGRTTNHGKNKKE